MGSGLFTRPEIIVHVYTDLPPVIEFPAGMEPEEMIRFDRNVEAWVRGAETLVAAGHSIIVCDHRYESEKPIETLREIEEQQRMEIT